MTLHWLKTAIHFGQALEPSSVLTTAGGLADTIVAKSNTNIDKFQHF